MVIADVSTSMMNAVPQNRGSGEGNSELFEGCWALGDHTNVAVLWGRALVGVTSSENAGLKQ